MSEEAIENEVQATEAPATEVQTADVPASENVVSYAAFEQVRETVAKVKATISADPKTDDEGNVIYAANKTRADQTIIERLEELEAAVFGSEAEAA